MLWRCVLCKLKYEVQLIVAANGTVARRYPICPLYQCFGRENGYIITSPCCGYLNRKLPFVGLYLENHRPCTGNYW